MLINVLENRLKRFCKKHQVGRAFKYKINNEY